MGGCTTTTMHQQVGQPQWRVVVYPPAVTLRRGVRGTVQAGRTPRRSSLFWRLVFAAAAIRGQLILNC